MNIRTARPEEAEEIAEVLRRSIIALCTLDHNNDPEPLASWLANKTAENVRRWIDLADQQMLVAVMDARIAGVGAAKQSGEITLNYVSPDYRNRGVSRAILKALEAYLRMSGATESRLISTATAHGFYQKAGYVGDALNGEPGVMWKVLGS